MRKYRARQRSDPVRYQQYLQRERVRNYKRKHEKRIRAAQQRAQALGIPYIVLDTAYRRGRKTEFDEGMFMVLPAKYEDDSDDETYSFHSDDMPMIPCKVELHESDEVYQERKPNISVVNINKLMNHPRSALQTLLPQEVNDRQRMSNFIKLEHDYVKEKTDSGEQRSMRDGAKTRKRSRKSNPDNDKSELMKLRQQCRSFILNKAISGSASHPKRRRRSNKMPAIEASSDYMPSNCVEHEDLDDLFKELAEVATKEPPKKKHSSPHKKSPRKHSPRKQCFFNQMQAKDGQFSLTVSMPVQPIVSSELKNIKCEPKSPTEECVESTMNSIPNEYSQVSKKISVNNTCNVNTCNEDSIEIKQEPTSDDYYF